MPRYALPVTLLSLALNAILLFLFFATSPTPIDGPTVTAAMQYGDEDLKVEIVGAVLDYLVTNDLVIATVAVEIPLDDCAYPADPDGLFSRYLHEGFDPVPNDPYLPYPEPFKDDELGIEWDGIKADGWDDDAPQYDVAAGNSTAGADKYSDYVTPR